MEKIDSLKPGMAVSVRSLKDNFLPRLEGRVHAINEGRIEIRLDEPSRDRAGGYSTRLTCIVMWNDNGRRDSLQGSVMFRDKDGITLAAAAREDRRNSMRLQTRAHFTFSIVDPERYDEARDEVRAAIASTAEEFNAERIWRSSDEMWEKLDEEFVRLNQHVAEINSKLDYVIACMSHGGAPEPRPRMLETLDISGAGLSFHSERPIEIDTLMRIDIELNRFPTEMVHCIARVRRNESEAAPEGQAGNYENALWMIGVEFEYIEESDRERIIKHVFRMQRKYLRARKGE